MSDPVGAVVSDAMAHLNAARKAYSDPAIGDARDGVKPGEWQADRFGLPPECPIQVLGKNEMITYVVDTMGQLIALKPSDANKKTFIALFGDRAGYVHWAWPRWGKGTEKRPPKVDSFDADRLWATISAAAAKKGLWDAVAKVRGRGAWQSQGGEVIYHCGDYLWIDGRVVETGEYEDYFYPRRPAVPAPWLQAVDDDLNPAPMLLDAIRSWQWERPETDPILLLGWIAVAVLSGALHWRPHILLTGDRGTGKSYLQKIIRIVLGAGLIHSEDASSSGLYQVMERDTLPIALDEFEGSNKFVEEVIRMTRVAASGGMRHRGSSDHRAKIFQASSPFMVSAINPPAMEAQDHSRFATLALKPLDPQAKPPVLADADTIGPRLLRRMLDNWAETTQEYLRFAEALKAGGHDHRGQMTYGTLLMGAKLLLGEGAWDAAGFNVEDYGEWKEKLSASALGIKDDETPNWLGVIKHLFGSRVEAWHAGERSTVGQLVEDLEAGDFEEKSARRWLAKAGLGLVNLGDRRKPIWGIAVPPKSVPLGKMFQGSAWGTASGHGGTWKAALKRGPEGVIVSDRQDNRVYINKNRERCVIIDLVALKKWQDEN